MMVKRVWPAFPAFGRQYAGPGVAFPAFNERVLAGKRVWRGREKISEKRAVNTRRLHILGATHGSDADEK